MSSLQNKCILLGVTGGIAAYKSAEIVRQLQQRGASVRVVMTPAAQEFITPLTLQALSGHPVSTALLDPEAEAGMGHIELARWADIVLIAPATADFLAKLVQGEGSDLLSTVCLACKAPLVVAPAMNQAMWANLATQENLKALQERGIRQIGPAAGVQACGDVGLGRMSESPDIVDQVASMFECGSLTGKTVLITAGPTREAIDPVRYLTNHSSGKMGYALAEAAIDAGAKVILVSGPTNLSPPERATIVPVDSAEEMLEAVLGNVSVADLFIAAAAVADYRPQEVLAQKLKKGDEDSLSLVLVKNPDIVATVAQLSSKPFTVGFAAETNDVVKYAEEKLARKSLDAIVANDVSNSDIGFNSDNNAVTVITAENRNAFSQRSKAQLARDLIALFADLSLQK